MSSGPPLPPLTPEQAAETNLPRILGVTAVFHLLALSFVGVRMYIRFIVIKAPKIDDAFMIVATAGALLGMICVIIQAPKGLGRHRQTINDDDFVKLRLLNWIYSLFSVIISFSVLKISIALSLLRLSRARWYLYSLYALMAFIGCYTLIALVSFLAYCTPISAGWDNKVKAKCYSREIFVAFSIFNNSCSMFSDVVCATLPIPIVWKLQMKLRTRIYLVIVLSLGYLTVAMGAVKAYWQIGAKRNPDTWFEHNIQFYGFLQFNLGIIVACAPTLKPLLGRALKLSSSDKFSGGYYADGTSKKQGQDSKRRTTIRAHEFELDTVVGLEKETHDPMPTGRHNSVYDNRLGAQPSGSEELILQSHDKRGILRTTEIEIHQA
jgi:hypothetical protein